MPTRFETKVIASAASKGWRVLTKGWPDFLLIKNGRLMAVEAKAKGDKLRPHQKEVLLALESAGIPTYVRYEQKGKVNWDFPEWFSTTRAKQFFNRDSEFDGLGVA